MIKSFFKDKKIIIYGIVLIFLSTILSILFSVGKYIELMKNSVLEDKYSRMLIIEEENIDKEKIKELPNVNDVTLFYGMTNIEVDKYENIEKVKESVESFGYEVNQAGKQTSEVLIEQVNTVKTVVTMSIAILSIFNIIIFSFFISLMINDNKEDIKLLRYLGYTKGKILKLELLKSSSVIVISSGVGIIVAKILESNIEKGLNIILQEIYPFVNYIKELPYSKVIGNYTPFQIILINLIIGILLTIILNRKKRLSGGCQGDGSLGTKI